MCGMSTTLAHHAARIGALSRGRGPNDAELLAERHALAVARLSRAIDRDAETLTLAERDQLADRLTGSTRAADYLELCRAATLRHLERFPEGATAGRLSSHVLAAKLRPYRDQALAELLTEGRILLTGRTYTLAGVAR